MKILGEGIIEEFIQDFHQEYMDLDDYIKSKCWLNGVSEDPDEIQQFEYLVDTPLNNKYGHFGRKNREMIEFLEAEAEKLDGEGGRQIE